MKTKLALSAVAAAIAVFSQGAFAQAASSPTRAEVKAGAKPHKAVAPAGEGSRRPTPSKASDKTRDAAQGHRPRPTSKSGKLSAAGEHGQQGKTQPSKSVGHDHRDERKAKTKADQQGRQAGAGWRGPERRSRKRLRPEAVGRAARSSRLQRRLFGVAFSCGASAQAFVPRAWRMSRTADLRRPLLVELEQVGRLEQLGERRVAVVARIERRLVADLLADRADARPAALARRRLDGVAQQVDQLGVAACSLAVGTRSGVAAASSRVAARRCRCRPSALAAIVASLSR